MSGGSAHGGKARRPRLLVVTDRYPVDPTHSPAAWMLPHLQALSRVADIEVVSLLRSFPRIKNLLFGGYDRDLSRHRRNAPAEEHPSPHVVVFHRRCFTVPDRLGWTLTPWLLRLQQRRWLNACIIRRRPDAMLVHYVHASASLAIETARANGVPVWIDENETLGSMALEGQVSLRSWILARLAQADVVIAQCSVQTAELRSLLPEVRLVEIPLGCVMDTEIEDPSVLDATVHAAEGPAYHGERGVRGEGEGEPGAAPIRLLCVTRLDQETKNVGLLLRGLAEARTSAGCTFMLTVAGDGYLRGKLQREALRLGLGDAVVWNGWVSPQKLQVLRREADAAVQPSAHESFGLTALEATGAGLPLVACAGAGVVPDLAALGAAVVPFHAVSPAAIATALCELAGRLPELRRQAIEARGRILSRYSWEAHAALYARTLRESMEKEDGRHR